MELLDDRRVKIVRPLIPYVYDQYIRLEAYAPSALRFYMKNFPSH